jgi:hypothetical protein
MPPWATVTLALGVGIIGVAGTLLATYSAWFLSDLVSQSWR